MQKNPYILLFFVLCGITAAQAQEVQMQDQRRVAFSSVGTDKATRLQFSPIEMRPVSQMWLDEQLDPILQQRRKLQQLMAERAQQSVIVRPKPLPGHEGAGEAPKWKFTIGNTSADNWSPFPDRMLDARTLRFPMPGGRTSGDRNKGAIPPPRQGK